AGAARPGGREQGRHPDCRRSIRFCARPRFQRNLGKPESCGYSRFNQKPTVVFQSEQLIMRRMPLFATCLLLAVTTLLASDPKTTMKAKNKLQDAIKAASNNNFEKMYELAKEAQSLDATLAEPYVYSGLYLYRTGESASAEKDFQKALTLDPNLSLP